MKKWWIALTVVGVILFITFTIKSGLTYHQMFQASEGENVSDRPTSELVAYILWAFIGVGCALFGGYKAYKSD